MERYHIFKLGLAILFYALYCTHPSVAENSNSTNPENDLVFYQGVRGKPGVDFPVYSYIPRTSFTCKNIETGYYADLETDCQVFHICEENKKISFLCPNGTIFQQSELICEWWFKVNCTDSPNFYEDSAEQLREDNARRKLSRRVKNHGAVMRIEEQASVSAFQNGKSLKNDHYRNVQSNDLSRASSSDFVRNQQGSKVAKVRFQESNRVRNQGNDDSSRLSNQGNQYRSTDLPRVGTSKKINNDYQRNQYKSTDFPRSSAFIGNQNDQSTTTSYNQEVNDFNQYSSTTEPSQTDDFSKPLNQYKSTVDSSRSSNQGNQYRSTDLPRGLISTKQENQYQSNNKESDFKQSTINNDYQQNQYKSTDFSKSSAFIGNQNDQYQSTTASYNQKINDFNQYSTTTQPSQNEDFSKPLNQYKSTDDSSRSSNQQNQYRSIDLPKVAISKKINNDYQQNHYKSTDFPRSSAFIGNQNDQYQSTTPSYNQKINDFNQYSTITEPSQNDDFSKALNQHKSTVDSSRSSNQGNQYRSTDLPRGATSTKQENQYQSNYNQNDFKQFDTIKNDYQRNQYKSTDFPRSSAFIGNQNNQHQSTTPSYNQKTNDFNQYLSTTESSLNDDFSKPLNQYKSTDHHHQTSFTFQDSQYQSTETNHRKENTDFNQYSSSITKSTSDFTKNQYDDNQSQNNGESSQGKKRKIIKVTNRRKLKNEGIPIKFNNNFQVTSFNSDEAQITQETSSFYKNSFNRIEQGEKPNRYLNHRETYGALKEPSEVPTKSFVGISSVTPHYLTTQSINSGKPFIGSQVGTTMKNFEVPSQGSTKIYPNTPAPFSLNFITPTPNPVKSNNRVTVPPLGSFNIGTNSIYSTTSTSTTRTPDYATIYGRFIPSTTVPPTTSKRTTILLTKSVFGTSTTTKEPLNVSAEILTASDSFNRNLPQVRFSGKVSSGTTNFKKSNRVVLSSTTPKSPNSLSNTYYLPTKSTTPVPEKITPTFTPLTSTTTEGFYVTRAPKALYSNDLNKVVRPRPFSLQQQTNDQPVFPKSETVVPTFPTYKISSASPFSDASTIQPTLPTPFTTQTTFDNVDSMINSLMEIVQKNFSDRPGLVIPPSAGPQTLHTLAVYFANGLDGTQKEVPEENLTPQELEKKKLTELLTQMTMERYNELFDEEKDKNETISDLEAQHSKGPVSDTPKVRQLAKIFTQALSSYLDDPSTFRKVLEEIRPTEPPATEDDLDDELLNFSDADAKSSFRPIFPTQSSWSYLIAYKNKSSDDQHDINTLENLQSADSQSFVSQYNKLQKETTTSKSFTQLPGDHWTTSPNVHSLWKSTFGFNPTSINDDFEVPDEEPPKSTTTEPIEVQYELKALPQLQLNSTQVHGILIDFMNSTKNDDGNRLQRILKKLNTTETEFLEKMKEIEANPLTRRLILLLISECGESKEEERVEANDERLIDPNLTNDNEDTRALQLLNSLYVIASRFGK